MKAILPIAVTPAILTSSTVPETDYAAWASGTTYAAGDRSVAAHRVFESAIGGNIGNDPTAGGGQWFDVGPTNRWAMFDTAAGPATSLAGTITLALALDDAANAIGLVDLQAASARVRVTAGASVLFDKTHAAPAATDVFLGIPSAANRTATVTITPTGGGTAIVGKMGVGTLLDLGPTEDAPTISLIDFSRRVTDAFGVTTVVERAWAKRFAARSRLDSSAVDGVQSRLAAVRATPLVWIGDEAFPSLTAYGFYKDFSVDLTIGATSFCSLTFESLPSATIDVSVIDPAPTGVSNFLVLRPANVTDYTTGARIIKAATHRIYESLVDDNLGNDPATDATKWLDVGPTNRWAMFDQALGTVTQRAGSITLTLTPTAAVKALAVLDASAASVRVQATGYDQTKALPAIEGSNATFLDLNVAAAGVITVTITAAGGGALASVGTLLIGTIEPLGETGDAPSIGINDFSVKTTDDFGSTTTVERAWSKRMAVKSLLSTSAVDNVLRRLATLRATPTLWIADKQFDSLAIYGFFRDASVQLNERVSTLGVTVEGLGKAAPAADEAADILALEAKIAALADAGIISAGSQKRDLIIQWNALYEDSQALDAKYVDLGSPADLTTPIATMDAALDALDALLTSLAPPWDTLTVDTPIPDPDAWNEAWNDAYAAVAAARAGITGRPALITLNSSADTFKFDAGGTIVARTITFTATRQNTTHPTIWTIYNNAGTLLATGSAATVAATGYFTRVNDDTLSISSTQFLSFINTHPERETFTVEAAIDTTALKASRSVGALYDGHPGTNGTNGLPGTPGADGTPAYVHFAYADSADGATNFTTGAPGSRTYIGVYTDGTVADSSSPSAYAWSLLKGEDGDGIPGPPGADGQTTYVHIAYATAADGSTGFSTTDPTNRPYIGLLTDFTLADSTTPTDYTWSQFRGPAGTNGTNGLPGTPGTNGTSTYIHTAYADSSDGSVNFTTGAAGSRTYLGVFVDSTVADSTTPSDYTWSLLKGANGSNGTPGAPGSNGQPSYVHFAYATAADGSTGFSTTDPIGRTYIGAYADFTLADSTTASDYTWSLIKGADGSTGAPGSPGAPGVSAINLSALPNPVTVPCTAGGTPKAAIPDVTLSATQGGTNIIGSLTYGTISSTGLTGLSQAGAVFSVAGMSADTGTLTIPVSNAGASAEITITYTKAKDGSAAFSSFANIGAPTSTSSYDDCGSVTFLMGPNGNINVDSNGSFSKGSGGGIISIDGYIEYSVNGGGYSTLGSLSVTPGIGAFSEGSWEFSSGVTGSSIGLTTQAPVTFRLRGKRIGTYSSFGGQMTVAFQP